MYTIRKMTEHYAKDYLNWRYPAPYEFYNIPEKYHSAELKEIMNNISNWFCIEKPGTGMIGFYEFTPRKSGVVEIGLGLRPDYTGRGFGLSFVRGAVRFGRQRFGPFRKTFVLRVAEFNQRAIKTYQRAGFKTYGRARALSHGKPVSFICMKLSA